MRVEPVGALGEGRLLPIPCAWRESTHDVKPIFDPWGVFLEYVCGDCLSGQEEPIWQDAMEAKYPVLDGTERY